MRRLFFTLLIPLLASSANAQLPKWVISPDNDTIFVKFDGTLLQSINNGKSTLWTMEGKELFSTDNSISDFKDDVATITQTLNNWKTIVGLVDKNGKFISLPNVQVAYANPNFEDGYLLCVDDGGSVFYRKDGSKAPFPQVVRVYPFHKGYAPYFNYGQLKKLKDPYFGYFKSDQKEMKYIINENDNLKVFDPKDITFLSSIGTNGKGIAVIKNKVYWFDINTEQFHPFVWEDEDLGKKKQLTAEGNYERYYIAVPDSVIIWAQYGKNKNARFKFDRELRPELITFDDLQTIEFGDNPTSDFLYRTTISEYNESGKYGLKLNSEKVLPAQFEEVGLRFGDKAIVKKNNKWGLVEIIPNADYSVKINKGEDIAFRHQKYETQIRLDLPSQISAKEVRIDIPEETGCLIDKTSRTTKDTESGNYVTYDCVLTIPNSLPDTVTTITYDPIRVSLDNISLFDRTLKVNGWHYKYYNVDPIESETSISKGVASFLINITKEGESDYPFEVRIEADSISVEFDKISETRYKCMVSNLKEGNNNLNIYVTEKGCPSSIFPFEIVYTKPAPKKKQKEEFVIRRKDPVTSKPTPRLEL